MNLSEITAALKAKYRPVFRGGMDREIGRLSALSRSIRVETQELTGAGRAIASITQGKGE